MQDDRRPVNYVVTDIPATEISFDAEAFDYAIRAHGVRLVHYRAMGCPVGQTDLNDNRQVHPDHPGCSGGFIYTKAGAVTVLFTSNSKHKNTSDMGFWDSSTVQVTFPTTYDDGGGFSVAPFDRFYLEEESTLVTFWQKFLHHESGVDRFKYPVVKVQDLVDNNLVRYNEGTDFCIHDGQIKWIGNRPVPQIDVGPSPSPDRGAVCSIRYLYHPFWYCGQIMHELRVAQISNPVTGARALKRMPQLALLHREYVPQNKQQGDEEAGNSGSCPPDNSELLRQLASPSYGGFGVK